MQLVVVKQLTVLKGKQQEFYIEHLLVKNTLNLASALVIFLVYSVYFCKICKKNKTPR